MIDIFHYGFIIRGLEAGICIAALAPLIGIFLVLRRYSLIADTLSHVSLAGVALGLILNLNPLLTALVASVFSSLTIERLRLSKKIYGESALSLFLSGSLALAIVLISLAHGFRVDLFSYLFGSIVTVTQADVFIIFLLGVCIAIATALFYHELLFISFDETAARVGGIPVTVLNSFFIVLTAVTIAVAIPIVGVLLVSALLVLPVLTALQFKKGFRATLLIAEVFSLASVPMGIVSSFYLNVSSGGTIVLIMLAMFGMVFLVKHRAT